MATTSTTSMTSALAHTGQARQLRRSTLSAALASHLNRASPGSHVVAWECACMQHHPPGAGPTLFKRPSITACVAAYTPDLHLIGDKFCWTGSIDVDSYCTLYFSSSSVTHIYETQRLVSVSSSSSLTSKVSSIVWQKACEWLLFLMRSLDHTWSTGC